MMVDMDEHEQEALAKRIVAALALEPRPTCSRCGRELAHALGRNAQGELDNSVTRLPCNPPYISVCHQPLGNPDWHHAEIAAAARERAQRTDQNPED